MLVTSVLLFALSPLPVAVDALLLVELLLCCCLCAGVYSCYCQSVLIGVGGVA